MNFFPNICKVYFNLLRVRRNDYICVQIDIVKLILNYIKNNQHLKLKKTQYFYETNIEN